MKIVVLLKEVPDTYAERTLSLETGLANRGAGGAVLDEVGERALELALIYADGDTETEVAVLSMTPESAAATVRKALAIGAGSAVQVVDERLSGADLGLTAEVLAAALRRMEFDLVIAGNISTDGSGGVIPAMIAELLNVPSMTALDAVTISNGRVAGVRSSGGATVTLSAELPAVVSITEALPGARFPNFKGVMAAKKKPYSTLSLDDLAIQPEDADAARSIILAVAEKPARKAGVTIVDEGDAGQKLADFLVQNRLV